jgi:CubicO group peptidase (beta-lactamase class C family)
MKSKLFFLFFLTFTSIFADNKNIEELVNSYLTTVDIPSLNISVVTKDKVLYKKSYGYRNIEESLPATEKTLYQVGSISKSITSVLFGICSENGFVDIDDKVVDFIPFFKLVNPMLTHEITFRDYLSHQSGYGCHDTIWYNKRLPRKEIIQKFQYIPESLPFRKTFYYQNLGYMIAAYGLECATGLSWEELTKEYILDPLKMTDTCLDLKYMLLNDNFAYGYTFIGGKNVKTPYVDPYTIAPAGGVCSNLNDMTKWTQFLLNKGGNLLYPETLEELCSPQMITKFLASKQFGLDSHIKMESYGLGFFIISYKGKKLVFHGGNIQGFSSLVVFAPEEDLGITVLTNKNQSIVPFLLAISIFEKLTDIEEHPWLDQYKTFAAYETKSIINERESHAKEQYSDTLPSFLLKDVVGIYTHPGYGECEITLDGEELVAIYNDALSPLEHWHFDVFNVTDECEKYHFKNIKFHFLKNFHGDVDSLSVLFDPFDGPIVFQRKVSDYFFSPEYLSRFTGDYSYMGFSFVIKAEDNKILVKALGQPPFLLKPEKECVFSVDGSKDYEGYMIKFLTDKDNKITAVQLVQPNGTIYSANKVNS